MRGESPQENNKKFGDVIVNQLLLLERSILDSKFSKLPIWARWTYGRTLVFTEDLGKVDERLKPREIASSVNISDYIIFCINIQIRKIYQWDGCRNCSQLTKYEVIRSVPRTACSSFSGVHKKFVIVSSLFDQTYLHYKPQTK